MRIEPLQRQHIADICRRYGVRSLKMFGSAARGDETPASDVDLLVEFAPGAAPSGFALVDLQDELSSVFGGRAVDLAFPTVLDNPFRRRAIEPELQPLFQ
jgi:predicted nucleotidyltransferase